jgi:hypothetical protein
MGGCGGGIDAAAKADIDRRAETLSRASDVFPGATSPAPKPLAVGQYVQYRVRSAKRENAFLTVKVVDELQGAWWLEFTSEGYRGKRILKLLVYVGDRSRRDLLDVRAARLVDEQATVRDILPEALDAAEPLARGLVALLAVPSQPDLPREVAVVPAGRFEGCARAKPEAPYGPFPLPAETWSHPLVPITALVRAVGDGKPTLLELVAWGDRGARGEVP